MNRIMKNCTKLLAGLLTVFLISCDTGNDGNGGDSSGNGYKEWTYLKTSTFYNSRGEESSRTEYTYDELWRPDSATSYSKGKRYIKRDNYVYGDKKLTFTETTYDREFDDIVFIRQEYEMTFIDNDWQLKETEKIYVSFYEISLESPEEIYTSTYKYDSQNRLIQFEGFSEGVKTQDLSDFRYSDKKLTFIRDKDNNPTYHTDIYIDDNWKYYTERSYSKVPDAAVPYLKEVFEYDDLFRIKKYWKYNGERLEVSSESTFGDKKRVEKRKYYDYDGNVVYEESNVYEYY